MSLRSLQKVDVEYKKICKGDGFVYACGDQLYVRCKNEKRHVVLKCHVHQCDSSAKLKEGVCSVGSRPTYSCSLLAKIIIR